MSLFKKIFSSNLPERKSGVYIIQAGSIVELNEMPGNGSINEIIASLGYNNSQVHTVFTFESRHIQIIGVKMFTRDIVFVLAKDGVRGLSLTQVISELNRVDWEFEYDSTRVEDILNDAISEETLTYDFLSSVLSLIPHGESTYLSNRFGILVHFENGLLKSYTYVDGFNAPSRWLRNLNPILFDDLYTEASKYQSNELDVIFEVNNQCEALHRIPDVLDNEFLPVHTNEDGIPSFYNLWVAHYSQAVEMENFTRMNVNRLSMLKDNEYIVNGFCYKFNTEGILENVETLF